MKRSKMSLSHYRLLSADMGQLIPVACFEALPGDSIQQATSMLVRVSPLVRPVMHPVTVRIHHWFVPYRLLWEEFEAFITGGTDGLGDGAVYPTITQVGGFDAGELADYLGVPPGVQVEVSALPFRAYALIFNEFYRDQDLIQPIDWVRTGGVDATTNVVVQSCAWEKDYFTSARPWPQKGPDVLLPLGSAAPVVSTGVPPQFTVDATDRQLLIQPASVSLDVAGGAAVGGQNPPFGAVTGLEADLANATAVSVNDVREAFALQRYQEARALFGSRYTEYLRYLGVRSSDARLQRPEYLGGGKQTIAFSEVLQVAPTTSGDPEGVGDLRGHGIAAVRSGRYRRFFEEHGVILSLMSVRPRTMYAEHLPRMWSRRTKEEFFQKELEAIGQQEVYQREVFAEADPGGATVFGYQDRYAEYRHEQSTVAGEFRSVLNDWHLARSFASAPTLNEDFVTCAPTDRVFFDQGSNDHLWIMVNHSIQARRPVSKKAVGRIF